ncbi:response regulator [Flavobacterium microcysteis]
MKKQNLAIALLDDDHEEHLLFKEVADDFSEIKSVLSFAKGKEMLDYLGGNDKNVVPDILFLDLNMPILSGLDCLIEIRKKEEYKNLPIIIYSTSSSEKDKEATYKNGANLYVNKPIEFSDMKKIFMEVLKINWKERSGAFNFQNFFLAV